MRCIVSSFVRVKPTRKKQINKVSAFMLYSKDTFERFAERLGTRRRAAVAKETGRAWMALTPAEKRPYEERAAEIKRQEAESSSLQDDDNNDKESQQNV